MTPPKTAATPPLFKADTATLTFAAQKDGKIRVSYAGWDDAKVVQPGEAFELVRGPQGVEGRIVAKPVEPEPDVDPFYVPDDPRDDPPAEEE